LLGRLKREQLPPSLSPASCLLSSDFVGGCWEAAYFSFQEQGLRGPASPSRTQTQKSRMRIRGFKEVTAFCTFTMTEIKQSLPAGGRPLHSPYSLCPPCSAAELWASSAELAAEQSSGKAVMSKDLVTNASSCSAFILRPEALYKASQQH